MIAVVGAVVVVTSQASLASVVGPKEAVTTVTQVFFDRQKNKASEHQTRPYAGR